VSSVTISYGRKLIILRDDLVGLKLNDRIRVVAFIEQDEHNKIYLTKDPSTDVYFEMRAYAFDKASNKGKKILWRDCQKRRRSRRFLEVLKHEGKILLLFQLRRVTFGRTSYLLGPGREAIEVEKDSDEDGDGKAQVYKPDDGSIDLGNLMEFPPLPTGKQNEFLKHKILQVPFLTDDSWTSRDRIFADLA
jgi:hypothetical protein